MKTMTIDDLMIFLLWLVLLVWCKREIDSGDVEVDVGQAGMELLNYKQSNFKYYHRL